MAAELENFEEDGNEKIGGKGGYPRKLISFGPLLSVGNFAIFLAFSFLFFIFSSYFSSSFGILGGTPPLKILGGHVPPPRFRRLSCQISIQFCLRTDEQMTRHIHTLRMRLLQTQAHLTFALVCYMHHYYGYILKLTVKSFKCFDLLTFGIEGW